MPLPNKLTIKVYPAEDLPGQWIAECEEFITQGNSPADAIWMAGDAAKLLANECKYTDKHKTLEHCFCRDDDYREDAYKSCGQFVECCHCGTSIAVKYLTEADTGVTGPDTTH